MAPAGCSSWLAGLGYTVDLVDPVPLHVEQALALGGFSAALGDARDLTQADDSYDAALLMGPGDPAGRRRPGRAAEASDAGLARVSVLPIESMLSWSPAIAERLADPEQRELVLEMLATIEQDPAVTNATSHLLAIGRVE